MERAETPVVAAADVLERAAALVRQGWCKHSLAQDAAGEPVYPTDEDACRWCASGAILRAVHDLDASVPTHLHAYKCVCQPAGLTSLGIWNDRQRSRRPVIAALKRAARLAREEGATDARS